MVDHELEEVQWRVDIVSRKERSFMFADNSKMFHITYYCSSLCEDGKERKCEREIWRGVIAMHYYKRLHIR